MRDLKCRSVILWIRPLRPDEREAWQPLWQAYLTFYESSVLAGDNRCAVDAVA